MNRFAPFLFGLLLALVGGAAHAQFPRPGYGSLVTGAEGLVATGASQIDAITLPNQVNVFTSVPVGTGAKLPAVTSISIGAAIEIINNDVNALTIYPTAGDSVYNGAINASITVAAGGYIRLVMLDPPSARTHAWQPAAGVPASGGTIISVYGTSNVQSGTTYTTVAADCGKTLIFTSNSSITVTVAASVVPAVGTVCVIAVIQAGSAKVSVNGSAVAAASLVSANSYTGTSGTAGAIIDLALTTIGSTPTAYLTGTGS